MIPDRIAIELLSDSTFSSGASTAGEVDIEVDHDDLGLPRFGGKALRGILRDTWLSMADFFPELGTAAENVLGVGGSFGETSVVRIDDATVEPDVRSVVARALNRSSNPLDRGEIVRSLTDIRFQTAENRATGAPATGSLRASRVWLRGLILFSRLRWTREPEAAELRCLSLALLGSRHVGLSRNRGRGCVRMSLLAKGDSVPDLSATRALAMTEAK